MPALLCFGRVLSCLFIQNLCPNRSLFGPYLVLCGLVLPMDMWHSYKGMCGCVSVTFTLLGQTTSTSPLKEKFILAHSLRGVSPRQQAQMQEPHGGRAWRGRGELPARRGSQEAREGRSQGGSRTPACSSLPSFDSYSTVYSLNKYYRLETELLVQYVALILRFCLVHLT